MTATIAPYKALLNVSVISACTMFALPFLNARHFPFPRSFFSEWWAAACLLIAGLALLHQKTWAKPLIPRIILLPAGLGCIVLFQCLLGLVEQPETAIFFLIYLLGAAFAMIVGQSLRQSIGLSPLALALAKCLLIGSLASALIGILSVFAPHWLPLLVENHRQTGIPLGNLMQPNHVTNYLWMGIAAACFLHISSRLSTVWLIHALAPLLMVSAMISSRSAFIYLFGLNLISLAWWLRSRTPTTRRLLLLSLSMIPFFILAQGVSSSLGIQTPTTRLTYELSGLATQPETSLYAASIKILESKIAIDMFIDHPWLGNGVGNFLWRSFVLAEQYPAPFSGHAEHSHNLVTHFLAELGIGSLLVLILTLALWWRGFASQKWSGAHVWIIAVLMIEAWHSMVEYPLWYAYFLLPTALLLGAADANALLLRPSILLRSSLWAFMFLCVTFLISLRNDYVSFGDELTHEFATSNFLSEYSGPNARKPPFGEGNKVLRELHRTSLLAPYVGYFYAYHLLPTSANLSEKLRISEAAMRFTPSSKIVYRHAMLLALAGRQDEALQQQRWAMHSFPERIPEYVCDLRFRLQADPHLPFAPLLHAVETTLPAKTLKSAPIKCQRL
ncbi:MAG: O-antigen ligase C-terminal domain-containing protein [Betaproteobacteria bacterium]|nr:O-antigen ligase C-terminal domain-containing protein [Betaproteobacteria bacterium]